MEVIENVACTVCGCVCDDLRITLDRGRIARAEGACRLAEPWFLGQDTLQPPVAQIAGQAASLEAALVRATDILRTASSPLIYGLSRSSTEGQRAAIALAEQIGATIDTTASRCHAPSVMALQEVGESTCTLGEIKNRADLVIFWGSNPVESHPRHFERYSVLPRGRFIPGGRADRTLVVADVKPTASTEAADLFLPVKPGCDFEALVTLRSLVRGGPVEATASTGAPLPLLKDLAHRMKSCRYGIVFFGLGLSMTGLGHHNVEALLLLVRDLNDYTRFFARRMRVQGDVTGADTVLTWQTGYPFSVSLSRGYPRYNPGEFSANNMLERGEVDACLLVGSEGVARFSEAAVDHLRRVPTIALDHPTIESVIPPTVRFTTAVYGVHRPGTVTVHERILDTLFILLSAFSHPYLSPSLTLYSYHSRPTFAPYYP
ncbi:MAG TPA: formylmethanofuran dehydrogenase subunit B, partial [Gemmataceae bacterium]|nr:formylmethanofuran dehydrogenase subunit B [Gemmataceae bacterium]